MGLMSSSVPKMATYKVSLHEPFVRQFTRLFEQMGNPDDLAELRDPFGRLVFLMHGIDGWSLKALSNLIYTGKCNLTSRGSMGTKTQY